MTDPFDPPTEELPAPEPAPRPRPPVLPWVVGIGLALLAVSQAALWLQVLGPPAADNTAARLQSLEDRVSRLEARPAPATPDLRPLLARITALEQRPEIPAPAETDTSGRLAADEARLAALEKATAATRQDSERAAMTARLQAAFAALAAGQPLGTIPNAPPALTRYATAAPPTEAALRLAYPAAAHAALEAGHRAAANQPFWDRAWAEARDVFTVRQGDHVLFGDPDAGVLARGRTALDAGDLAGAVAAVATLTGPAAQAMADWLDRARGLLAARAALADLAAHP